MHNRKKGIIFALNLYDMKYLLPLLFIFAAACSDGSLEPSRTNLQGTWAYPTDACVPAGWITITENELYLSHADVLYREYEIEEDIIYVRGHKLIEINKIETNSFFGTWFWQGEPRCFQEFVRQ